MINDKLDTFFEGWKTEMNKSGYAGFCYDGLIYRNGAEDRLWKNANRRIVFLLKEQNDNDGEDVREWSGSINGYSPHRNFFIRLSAWLYGLTHATANSYPSQRDAFDNKNQMAALTSYPYAYVNLKKQTGGAKADDGEIYRHSSLFSNYLRKQLDILNGNIIYCAGETVFKATKKIIYGDLVFENVNSWIYYNSTKKLLLISGFHPTATKSNEQMYDWMMKEFTDFLNKKYDY